MRPVIVVDYDPTWPATFERLRAPIWAVVSDIALAIEHVGSTSVPGLAAKPIIDISVVVPDGSAVRIGIERLAALGYEHQGDLGIDGREAFRAPASLPAHNLYVCPDGNLVGLVNQVTVRDYLRAHPDVARQYGELKKTLAARFPNDITSYVVGKTDFVLGVLRAAGLSPAELETIRRANA